MQTRHLQHSLQKQIHHLGSYLLMTFLAFIFLYPTFNMTRLSLLSPGRQGPIISLQRYIGLFREVPFERYFMNSTIVTLSTILPGLFVNSLIAYVMARTQWRWRYLILGLVIALMIIPFEALAIPLLLLTNFWGWLDSYHVQIIPFIADPLSIFLFYQFFINLSQDLEDAALVDGMGRFRIFWQIVVPVSRPVFATVAILKFLFLWDSYLWPVMVTRGPEFRPLTVGLRHAFGLSDLTAYATLMTLPTLILFLLLQQRFVKSVAAAGARG
jgi:multiple sugar transport system permease protein